MANTPQHMRKFLPQLGECFKVVIHSESSAQIIEKIREQLLSRKNYRVRHRPSFFDSESGGSNPAPRRGAPNTCGGDSGDDHQEARTAASAAKAAERQVAKKAKIDEAERKKADKAAEAQKKARTRTVVNIANKVIGRISPIDASFENSMSDESFQSVLGAVKSEAKAAQKAVHEHLKLAKEKLSQEEPADWGNEFKDKFADEAKQWSEVAALLASQIVAVRKANM